MKTKILVSLLAVSLTGVASAQFSHNTKTGGVMDASATSGVTTVTLTSNATFAKPVICTSSSCSYATTYSIPSTGFMAIYACATKSGGVTSNYTAPTAISVNYNYQNATCSFGKLSGATTVQSTGSGANGDNGSNLGATVQGSLAVLTCVNNTSGSTTAYAPSGYPTVVSCGGSTTGLKVTNPGNTSQTTSIAY